MNDPYYINTDLEIDSNEDLAILSEQFGDDVVVMYNGEWGENYRAAFEIPGGLCDINGAIGMFCTLVESLNQESRELWDNSYSKTFSVGFGNGNTNAKLELAIEPYILTRVSSIGASISIVIYPPN